MNMLSHELYTVSDLLAATGLCLCLHGHFDLGEGLHSISCLEAKDFIDDEGLGSGLFRVMAIVE